MKKLTFMTMLAFCIAMVGFSIEACAEDLEISGFFDVTTSYNHNADDKTDFAMNQAEVDMEKQLSDIASASVAIAYNSEESVFELAVAEVGINLYENDNSFLTSINVYGGQFDVPFGIDYNVYASIDRKLVSAPLAVDLTHCGWNDFGAKVELNATQGNLMLFWVNGFTPSDEVIDVVEATLSLSVVDPTPANAFGGRLGVAPVENLEIGGSFSMGINESNENEMLMFGGDLQWAYDKFQVKGEYITHSLNRSVEEVKNQGYYAQALYNFGQVFLVGRYGSFQFDSADWTNRISAGIGFVVTEGVELRWESTIWKDSDNNTNLLQLVAGF
jgi:hypothetical protein